MAREKAASFASLSEQQRQQAMVRFVVLRPYLEEGVPLTRAAAEADIPLRTAQRWLARYRRDGASGLARPRRQDAGRRRAPADLVALVEGLGLKRPRFSAAAIHLRVGTIAKAQGWPVPSYGTVRAILAGLDPAMMMLAQNGPAAFRDRYELICRHRAAAPNALWQADHTLLDILVLDEAGKPARPWLTTAIDDYSRRIYGLSRRTIRAQHVSRPAPRDLAQGRAHLAGLRHTGRALRRSRQRFHQPAPRSGRGQPALPHRLLRCRTTAGPRQDRAPVRHDQYRAPARAARTPRRGQAGEPPRLSLAELDQAIGAFIAGTYHVRAHSETGQAPLDAWRSNGFLPRSPESLEELDLLLVMLAKPRCVRRDGIYFQGLRYVAPTLAAYVGEAVTIRYARRLRDPGLPPQRLPLPGGERGARQRGFDAERHRDRKARPSPGLARDHQRARRAVGGFPASPVATDAVRSTAENAAIRRAVKAAVDQEGDS